eukprot:RCo026022
MITKVHQDCFCFSRREDSETWRLCHTQSVLQTAGLALRPLVPGKQLSADETEAVVAQLSASSLVLKQTYRVLLGTKAKKSQLNRVVPAGFWSRWWYDIQDFWGEDFRSVKATENNFLAPILGNADVSVTPTSRFLEYSAGSGEVDAVNRAGLMRLQHSGLYLGLSGVSCLTTLGLNVAPRFRVRTLAQKPATGGANSLEEGKTFEWLVHLYVWLAQVLFVGLPFAPIVVVYSYWLMLDQMLQPRQAELQGFGWDRFRDRQLHFSVLQYISASWTRMWFPNTFFGVFLVVLVEVLLCRVITGIFALAGLGRRRKYVGWEYVEAALVPLGFVNLLLWSLLLGYVLVVALWLVLASLLNPNGMLPYASAVLCFAGAVRRQYIALRDLRDSFRGTVEGILEARLTAAARNALQSGPIAAAEAAAGAAAPLLAGGPALQEKLLALQQQGIRVRRHLPHGASPSSVSSATGGDLLSKFYQVAEMKDFAAQHNITVSTYTIGQALSSGSLRGLRQLKDAMKERMVARVVQVLSSVSDGAFPVQEMWQGMAQFAFLLVLVLIFIILGFEAMHNKTTFGSLVASSGPILAALAFVEDNKGFAERSLEKWKARILAMVEEIYSQLGLEGDCLHEVDRVDEGKTEGSEKS